MLILDKQEKVKKSAPKGASKILEDNRSAGGDQMSSRASNLSMGSTIVSLLKAQGQGGTNEELLSVLDTVDAETRSVLSNMSHASATSYLSFLSVIDAAAIEREELQRHESADHNTNLALIFFEQLVLSISQFIESLSEVTLTASGLVDTAWKQLERLFLVVQESLTPLDASIISSMSVEHRRVLIALDANPLFQFSHDMRYNGGLGYQILGVLFARIMSPLLDMENEATTFLIPQELQDASRQRGGARWSQLRSAQQESALAACLGVYESIAPQVINMHLNQIIRVVAAATSKTSDDSAPHEIAHSKMLELFLARIIVRLGKSNSALSVMNNFLKLVSDTDVTDTEVQRALQLMLRPSISASIKQSMEDCMDIESVLAYLGRVVEFLTGNEDEESHASAPSTTKAHLALGILEVVTLGVVPSTLTSSMIVERIAEVDLLLSTFIAASTKQGETVVRGLRALYSVRLVLDRCMVDLGVANMEQYVKVLEESLWQFETNATSIVTMGPRDLLDIVEAFSGDSVHLVCALTLQRLTLAHSVSTILGFSSAIRRHLKTLATFVLDQYARSSTARSAMMRLTLAQWKALSFYAKKSLIAAFVPVIREQCALGVSVETFLGDWSTAAGDVLDALTVLLLEATSDAKELPVLLAALALLVKGRATVPRLPQVLQCLVRLLPNAPQPTTACRLADLILLLLQCNARAAKHITSGRKPLDESHVRAAFTEYVAEPDELVTEELEAAAELPALYFASSLATFLVSSSSTLESHGRLLCTLFGLAAQRSNSEFVQAVVSALQCSVTSKAYNVLETFLSLVHTSHMDFAPKKRTRDDKPTSSSSSVFGAIATSLLQTLVKNSTNVDAHVLRVLRILVLLPGHASTLRDSHVDINGASLASHSADGIVVAIGLAFGDDSATKMLLAALQDADADTHHWDHMVQLLPLVVRSFSSDNSVVGWVLQKTLQSAVKAAATTSSTIHNTLSCLLELSRVSTFRFSLVKGHVKRFLDTAIMARVAACKTRDVSLDDIQIVLRLLRLPLSQYHGDESFVDVELMLMQLLPDFISAFAQGATGSVLAQCSSLVRDVFHILSSTFLDFNVFRHRAHLLAPLIGAWFTHILRGLDSGYNGSVTNALASFFFRLGRSLQRSLDLSDKGHESSAALQLGLSTDAFLLQQASIAGTMFTLSSSYLGNFARYAPELDFVASDILKLLHREKLPDVFARLSKKGESNKKNLSKSSYADLAFACVGGEEGKNLLRQALMNAVDGDTAGDSSIIFSARERYLQ